MHRRCLNPLGNRTFFHSSAFRLQATASSSSTQLEIADPLLLYYNRVTRGLIQKDDEQIRALVQMRKVHAELLDYQPPVRLLTLLESLRPTTDRSSTSSPEWPFQRSSFSSAGQGLTVDEQAQRKDILSLSNKERSKALVSVLHTEANLEGLTTPRGFLLTGPPGTGKTMLMDLFMDSLPISQKSKSRWHYHHFLLNMYTKIHDALETQRAQNEAEERYMNDIAATGGDGYSWSRKEEMKALAITKGWRAVFAGGRSPNDPRLNVQEFVLVQIARDFIKEHGWVLAFDEVQLLDIAGAGLINRVLSWYWRLGGVVVASSNRLPQDLYNSGVARESMSSFLVALASRSPVIELLSPLDYRRQRRGLQVGTTGDRPPGDFGTLQAWERWGAGARGWFIHGAEDNAFDEAVSRIVGTGEGESRVLRVYGRDLVIPWALGGVARFSFTDLCEQPLGAADYISLASTFHTIILTDVPVILLSAKNEARRLITLIDALYETKTRLIVSAEADVDDMFFPDAVDLISSASSEDIPPPSAPMFEGDALSFPSNSALRARTAVDPAGDVGDSLVEEFWSEVQQDLDAPYRPNASSYDSSSGQALYSADDARVDQISQRRFTPQPSSSRTVPHPSAATPSFKSLAIFTGEEERFAFKRAVSRVHEMSSLEYLNTAVWTPLASSLRTWERPKLVPVVVSHREQPSLHSMGEKSPLSGDVPTPRPKYPDGVPSSLAETRPEPPVIKEEHVWGVRSDWGPRGGEWGQGVDAKKPKPV